MTTSEYVSLFITRFGGQFSRAHVLKEMNVAQNEVLALPDTPWARTKGDVFLSTTEGVFEYTLAVGVRTVGRVYVRKTDVGYGDSFPWDNHFNTRIVGTKEYDELDIPFDISEATDPNGQCTLYFNTDQDLGTTTDVFRLDQYEWPSQLTSESVPMELPEPVVTSLIYYIVQRRVQESAYGVDIYNDAKVKELLSRWTSKEASRPSQSRVERMMRF